MEEQDEKIYSKDASKETWMNYFFLVSNVLSFSIMTKSGYLSGTNWLWGNKLPIYSHFAWYSILILSQLYLLLCLIRFILEI